MPSRALKESLRHFTPAWHTVVMGTGALSACISHFPFGHDKVQQIFTAISFFLTFVLFVAITAATICRYILFPEMWSVMIQHPTQSLYVAAFAMGGAVTISDALATFRNWSVYGAGFVYTLWAFWWLDIIVSLVTLFGMFFAMISIQKHQLERMTPLWFLPIVTLVVASSTGAIVADGILVYSREHALLTVIVSSALLIAGLSFVMLVLPIWFLRLLVYGPPSTDLILSVFIALGPLGQGGFSFLLNGKLASQLFPSSAPLNGPTVYTICLCASWCLWTMGAAWIIIAVLTIVAEGRRKIPFSLGYWGTVFPNATWALCSVQLGKDLRSPFFSYIGSAWSVLVFALWSLAIIKTVPAVWNQSIFQAPCINEKLHERQAAQAPAMDSIC